MLKNWVVYAFSCALSVGCSGVSGRLSPPKGGDDGGAGGGEPDAGVPDLAPPCETSISGTVYAPNGTLPLYNVRLYIPKGPLSDLPKGVSCERCGTPASGGSVTTALSDHKGHFRLAGAPSGSDIPLVIQVGKWRRQVVLPKVTACQDNPITNAELTRLPKNRSEGNLPRIAVTVGQCDQIACLLPKIGIDKSEYGVGNQDKAVIFYTTPLVGGLGGMTEGPAGMTEAKSFWGSASELAKFDMVILSCECWEAPDSKDAMSYRAMTDYLDMGGRIFSTDFQYTWYKFSPDSNLASFGNVPGGAPPGARTILLDATFPKGKALADWMSYTKLSTIYGQVMGPDVFDNIHSVDKAKAQTWGSSGGHPRFVTINTPVGLPADQQCGKAVHLDAHINLADTVDKAFPLNCQSPIGSAEGAFAFFFFDLASCIQDDKEPPIP